MSLRSYKLNNSYTVYVNHHYLNDCVAARKARERKKKELAEIEKRVKQVLQSQKNYHKLEKQNY